jgi:hemerythrin-like metal-binding protein
MDGGLGSGKAFMPTVEWNESFSVGNALLDGDHRILITLINQLLDATDTGQSREVVGSIVNVLAEYVEQHFRREESMFLRGGFPDAKAHIGLHHELEARVGDARDRWLAGEREALREDVLALLKKWLTDHILVADKAYGPWVGGIRDNAAADTAGAAPPASGGLWGKDGAG